jgi:hypothetical protein
MNERFFSILARWGYGTWGRWRKRWWEPRVLIDAGILYLFLGEIFCPCMVSTLELGLPQPGSLRVCPS